MDNTNMEYNDENCGTGLKILAEPEFEYLHYRQETDVKKYTLRISLKGIRPTIWRKVEVPSNIIVFHLGEMLVQMMGWSGQVSQHFERGREYWKCCYGEGLVQDFIPKGKIGYDQEQYTIRELLSEKESHIYLVYGEWLNMVRVCSIDDYADGDSHCVKFIDGRRACPPENCSDLLTYNTMLKLQEDYKSPEPLLGRMDFNDVAYLQMMLGPDADYDKNHLDVDQCREIARKFSD